MTDCTKLSLVVALAALLSILATALGQCHGNARADEQERTQLARMVTSEAGYRPGDEAYAILRTLDWRRTHLPAFEGWTLAQVGRAYCSGFGGRRTRVGQHTRDVLALPSNRLPGETVAAVRRYLEAPQTTPDPCPDAQHWRDRQVPARWEPYRMTCHVTTHNVYFRGEP